MSVGPPKAPRWSAPDDEFRARRRGPPPPRPPPRMLDLPQPAVAGRIKRQLLSTHAEGTPGSEWATPPDLFESLNREFHFGVDLAANEQNHKCPTWLGPGGRAADSLTANWEGWAAVGGDSIAAWLNPPYGRGMGRWMRKCAESAQSSKLLTVVALIFARTDTSWWHDYVMAASEIRLMRGRVRFLDPVTGKVGDAAPAPSCIVIWRYGWTGDPVFRTAGLDGRVK